MRLKQTDGAAARIYPGVRCPSDLMCRQVREHRVCSAHLLSKGRAFFPMRYRKETATVPVACTAAGMARLLQKLVAAMR